MGQEPQKAGSTLSPVDVSLPFAPGHITWNLHPLEVGHLFPSAWQGQREDRAGFQEAEWAGVAGGRQGCGSGSLLQQECM